MDNLPKKAKYNFNDPDFDITKFASDVNHYSEKVGDELYIKEVMTGSTVLIVDQAALFDRRKPRMEIVYLEDGTPFFTALGTDAQFEVAHGIEFSPFIIDVICQKIVEGPVSSLSKICKMPGMPSYTSLMKWRRANPWIDEQLEKARYDRAEVLRDEALDHAMEATNKDNAPAAGLKYEAKRWAAGIDNTKYSPKSKVDVAISQPTIIQVVTGIDRETQVELPMKDVTNTGQVKE